MTITIELPADIEAQLRESAARGDVEAMKRILSDAVTTTVGAILSEPRPEVGEHDFEAIADELANHFAEATAYNPPCLTDDAISREAIYQGHP
jgi:hypothetical protein